MGILKHGYNRIILTWTILSTVTFLGTVDGDVVALIFLSLIRFRIGGNRGRSIFRAIRVPIMVGVLMTSLPSGIRISSEIQQEKGDACKLLFSIYIGIIFRLFLEFKRII